jgi:hypothetical protein
MVDDDLVCHTTNSNLKNFKIIFVTQQVPLNIGSVLYRMLFHSGGNCLCLGHLLSVRYSAEWLYGTNWYYGTVTSAVIFSF